MIRVVIIGGSTSGLITALELKRRVGKDAAITVFSLDDKYVYSPALPSLIVGRNTDVDVSFLLESFLSEKEIDFIHSRLTHIDVERQRVSYGEEGRVQKEYDYLVLATGSDYAFSDIPGIGPKNGYTHSFLSLEHAILANTALNTFLTMDYGEIVIGNAQGGSHFIPSYELVMMIDTMLRKKRKRSHFKLSFFSPEPFLGHFGIGGVGMYHYVWQKEFQSRDIDYHLNAEIEGITHNVIALTDETTFKYQFAVITPPFKGSQLVRDCDLGNPLGYLPVDKHYRHTRLKNIYGVGEAVAISPSYLTPVSTGVPKTEEMSVQMAVTAAKHLASLIRKEAEPVVKPLSINSIIDGGSSTFQFIANPFTIAGLNVILRSGKLIHWKNFLSSKKYLKKIQQW